MRLTKKITVLLVFVAVLLAAPIIIFANDIRVSVDGEFVNFPDAQPTIVDIRTLVPVRAVFEKAGFYVGWDEDTKTAIITNETYTILITIGNATFYTNGISHLLDVPAQIIGTSTMVPIRLPLESVGFFVDWDEATRTVIALSPIEEIVEEEPFEQEQPTEQQSRMGQWDSIQIIGDANFVARNQAALDLIQAHSPYHYEMVVRYVGILRQWSSSGMWYWLSPPEFRIGTATYMSSTIWLATTIVHDAWHSWQAYHYDENPFIDPHSDAWFNAEMDAIRVQIDFLRAINAPRHYITHSESMIGQRWWLGPVTW